MNTIALSDKKTQAREIWLDYARAFACVLVALGHLFMSFKGAAIVPDVFFVSFPIEFIYYFHVYIFFFCSGYLFQKSFSKCESRRAFFVKKAIRCIDFLIPYVIFSFLTYYIKSIFSSSVNSPVETGFIGTLFLQPIDLMWYLYTIILIIAVTPVIKSHKGCTVISILATAALLITIIWDISAIPPLSYLMKNYLWFFLGMLWAYKKININPWICMGGLVVFVTLSLLIYFLNWDNDFLKNFLTLISLISIISLVKHFTKSKGNISVPYSVLSTNMLQIYLMHTICAAGIRIILLKLGVTNFIIHLIFGLIFSFLIPILCAKIAEKIKVLDIVFFPSKTIKSLKATHRSK